MRKAVHGVLLLAAFLPVAVAQYPGW